VAKQSGIGQRLYAHGYDLSGDVGAINTFRMGQAALDVTAIDKDAYERIHGLGDGELTFATWFNTSALQEHAALSTLPTTDRLCMWLTGTTRGDAALCITGKQVNYDWTRGADGALAGSVQVIASAGYPPEPARLLTERITHASATNVAGIDGGASSASGGVGYLQHFSASSGTVGYIIQDSADNVSFATILTFTSVATPWAPTAQRVEISGTVRRYVRASTTGTFSNASFAMAFRRRLADDIDAA